VEFITTKKKKKKATKGDAKYREKKNILQRGKKADSTWGRGPMYRTGRKKKSLKGPKIRESRNAGTSRKKVDISPKQPLGGPRVRLVRDVSRGDRSREKLYFRSKRKNPLGGKKGGCLGKNWFAKRVPKGGQTRGGKKIGRISPTHNSGGLQGAKKYSGPEGNPPSTSGKKSTQKTEKKHEKPTLPAKRGNL